MIPEENSNPELTRVKTKTVTVDDITNILHRWPEHFDDLLGTRDEELSYERREESVILVENEEDDKESLVPSHESYDEVLDSIKKLRNNKAAGSDLSLIHI